MEETSKLGSGGGVGTFPERKTFTLEHANKTLPLVGRIVEDLVDLYRQMATTQQRLAGELASIERDRLERDAERQERQFDLFVDELIDVGCELKDANIGLVDFIGRHDGRDVYLCWRLGEKKIEFWHELHAGFGGRRPVSTLNEE